MTRTAPMRSGQTVSYAGGDDGDLLQGVPWISARFIDHGDGTVTDQMTGLMWRRDAYTAGVALTWGQAVTHCLEMDYANYEDWRLPTIRELLSLADFGRSLPALPENHPFINVQLESYWTSSVYVVNDTRAWNIGLVSGVLLEHQTMSFASHVWAVRNGP